MDELDLSLDDEVVEEDDDEVDPLKPEMGEDEEGDDLGIGIEEEI